MVRQVLKNDRNGRPRGFTLIEVLWAILLASVVFAAVIMLFTSSNQVYISQDKMITTTQMVRATMEVLTHDLRMAGYVPMDYMPGGDEEIAGLERLVEATTSALTFVSDLNGDGTLEKVRYYLGDENKNATNNGPVLWREGWSWSTASKNWEAEKDAGGNDLGPIEIAENITGLQLEYTFENGDTDVVDDTVDGHTRADVRAIIITMTGQTETPVKIGFGGRAKLRERILKSVVKMRNMGLDPYGS